ncbi:MAG TPA: hypothetical protein VGS11_07550 [Candidatus Bathyarchaeia archaeon]|nr:hypothetical protein [Candidatus Bathyarchaeia archaeon]
MKPLSTSNTFFAFQFLTEGMCGLFVVLGLSPNQITFQGEFLGAKLGFSTGQLLPLSGGLATVVVLGGILAFFVTLFFSLATYALRSSRRRTKKRSKHSKKNDLITGHLISSSSYLNTHLCPG